MNPLQLFDKIYYHLRANNDTLVREAKSCWGEHRWETKLSNGVVISRHLQDEGYTQCISVPSFLYVTAQHTKELVFYKGDENALLTIARMLDIL